MKDEVERALKDVRPMLQADGGDVELVNVDEDGVVKVRLTGGCSGCYMAHLTLSQGIERHLKKTVPQVKRVEAVD